MVDVGRWKIEEEWFILMHLNPTDRFAGQRGADLIIVVKVMGFFGSANIVEFPLFLDDFGLRQLAVDEWIVGIEADHAVIFDIHKRWVAVHDRHAEVVVEAEL